MKRRLFGFLLALLVVGGLASVSLAADMGIITGSDKGTYYQFGLNLIKNNTGQTEFAIPREALANPDKFLSDRVVSSYRKE